MQATTKAEPIRAVTSGTLALDDITIADSTAGEGAGIFANQTNLRLSNSSISGNVITGSRGSGFPMGGGIFAADADVVLTDSNVSGNRSYAGYSSGTGIFVTDSTLAIIRSTVSDNQAQNNLYPSFGGAVHGESSTISIDGSVVIGNRGGTRGGGISADESTLMVLESSIEANRGWNGAGIWVRGTSLTVADSQISDNFAGITIIENDSSVGGGIAALDSEVLVERSIISKNKQVTNDVFAQGGGAGMWLSGGSLHLQDSRVTGNRALMGMGGGLAASSANIVISTTTIDLNEADNGGGLFLKDSMTNIDDSAVFGNSAIGDDYSLERFTGGAFHVDGSSLRASNTTISGNQTASGFHLTQGGAFFVRASDLDFVNSTIVDNRAVCTTSRCGRDERVGGGFYFSDGESSLELQNSIVAENAREASDREPVASDFATAPDANAQFEIRSSLIGNGEETGLPPSPVPDEFGNLIGGADDPMDPMLADLSDNGGPTLTHASLQNSPVIDAGSDKLATDSGGLPLAFDQRGSGYIRIAGDSVDMGAFEVQPLRADFDGDGDVDSADRTILTQYWTGALKPGEGDRTFEQGDADGDGDVDSNDLTILTQDWTGARQGDLADRRTAAMNLIVLDQISPKAIDEAFSDDGASVKEPNARVDRYVVSSQRTWEDFGVFSRVHGPTPPQTVVGPTFTSGLPAAWVSPQSQVDPTAATRR